VSYSEILMKTICWSVLVSIVVSTGGLIVLLVVLNKVTIPKGGRKVSVEVFYVVKYFCLIHCS